MTLQFEPEPKMCQLQSNSMGDSTTAAANGLAVPGAGSGSCPMVQTLCHTVSLHYSPFACLNLPHECISCH